MAYDLSHKNIFITGASSGIGYACATQFAAVGANLIITARRLNKLSDLAKKLTEKYGVKVLPLALDVQDANQVETVFKTLPDELATIDVLVNNAGLALSSAPMQSGVLSDWDTMIDTNIKGLLYVTRACLPKMLKRNVGHIINIGSIAGRDYYPNGNVYCATKHAVKALSHGLRLDTLGSAVRVSEICPGAVHTEFSEVRWKDKEKSDQFYSCFTPLIADDIADAVVYCATRPLHVDVAEMIIYPTDQASCNHIHRKEKI